MKKVLITAFVLLIINSLSLATGHVTLLADNRVDTNVRAITLLIHKTPEVVADDQIQQAADDVSLSKIFSFLKNHTQIREFNYDRATVSLFLVAGDDLQLSELIQQINAMLAEGGDK